MKNSGDGAEQHSRLTTEARIATCCKVFMVQKGGVGGVHVLEGTSPAFGAHSPVKEAAVSSLSASPDWAWLVWGSLRGEPALAREGFLEEEARWAWGRARGKRDVVPVF